MIGCVIPNYDLYSSRVINATLVYLVIHLSLCKANSSKLTLLTLTEDSKKGTERFFFLGGIFKT